MLLDNLCNLAVGFGHLVIDIHFRLQVIKDSFIALLGCGQDELDISHHVEWLDCVGLSIYKFS
jgi:hypothetical protein